MLPLFFFSRKCVERGKCVERVSLNVGGAIRLLYLALVANNMLIKLM